ncbi:hypothetical protein [Dokdonella sp.]|uniref:hypothetical protein n=1 Tax=Dokdonella sp. TaxID=2291710 RepID=UPI002F3E6B56
MFRHRSLFLILVLAACAPAHAANPLSFVSETFGEWKDRLFGKPKQPVPEIDAPAVGPILLAPGTRVRFGIDAKAPENEFSKGRSRYRVIELPEELEHAAVRVQVIARKNPQGHGNVVFKPLLYVIEGDDFRVPVDVKPLHLDIRPFRRSRLLGCVTLDKVRRIAVATTPDAIGKSYESEVRDAVKAATPGGFYYTTDAVKTKLPFAPTGELIFEVTREAKAGEGC